MKRYLISVGERVNEHASKTGIKFRFQTRTDDWEKYVRENGKFHENGIRVKDSVTKEIIYQEA